MSVLDALTILGGGFAKGYRARQELLRQLAEDRRKALLEDREMAIREKEAQLDSVYKDLQTQSAALDLGIKKYGFEQTKETTARGAQPISPEAGPLFKIKYKDPSGAVREAQVANRQDILSDPNISDFFRETLKMGSAERIAALGATSRVDVAQTNAASRRDVQSLRNEVRIKYGIGAADRGPALAIKLAQIAQQGVSQLIINQEERRTAITENFNNLLQLFPEALETVSPSGADTTKATPKQDRLGFFKAKGGK